MRAPVLALLLLAPLAGCASGPASEAPPLSDSDEGGAGPAWSFTDTEGERHARDAPPGNATVLFWMATWCSSCRSKAPLLADAHADYAPRGARFYSVSFDPTEGDADLRAWQERHAQPWPHGVDAEQRMARAFGVTSQSSVVVLDAAGRPVASWGYGAVTAEGLRDALDRALAQSPHPNSP